MDWSDGYVVDAEYTSGFFRKQSPAHLGFTCVLNGFEPVPLDRPFTYFELGCGQGFTANVLAASNPQGRFYAADFLPSHVAAARELADAARLDNITLLENSFAELAAGRVEVPPLDFITMHGVYSWVTPENRRHIVDFIARHLKPGGIVYVTYNAMPGWAAAAPLQRLVMEHAGLHPNARDVQVQEARTFVDRMIEMKAEYFNANATPGSILQNRLDSWRTDKPMYLAHEYMNRCWQALYHADVARDLAAAKLDYVGSADYCHAFPKLCLTPQQRELLATVPDPAWRETVKDYLQNTGFRSDVFVRGARRLSAPRRTEWLQQVGLALTVPRAAATMGMTPETMTAQDDVNSALLDMLARGPRSLAELAALRGQNVDFVMQAVALLAAQDQGTAYFLCSAAQDPAPALRLNRAIAQQSRRDDRYQALASPLLGSGMGAGLLQRLVYLSLQQHSGPIDALAIARQAWQIMKEQGEPIVLTDKPLPAGDEALAEILRTVKPILELRLPIWRQAGML